MQILSIPIPGLCVAEFDEPPLPRAQKTIIHRARTEQILSWLRPEADNTISHTSSGKPFLISKDLSISISHSGSWQALYLLDAVNNVGVDVEQIASKALRLVERFCGEQELQALSAYSQEDRLIAAHLIWSAKETAYKIFEPSDANFKERFQCHLPAILVGRGQVFSFWLTYTPIEAPARDLKLEAWIDTRFVLTAAFV